ncbi:acyl-CoA N-acyltransferase [Amniculicola lignicola CBS 123094]|uniref:Acyl-CoA N-acyltransferase n=1 Tax=Amniculicola lignicola CBS 123094 TaxID=1392246 RepID=A0A6A5X5B6_9PLEO|nr:acyl-CoA N-acyltransferase [Amniculicola lignicola CBS 123094]
MSVVVEQYNPEWPKYFESIKAQLLRHLHNTPILSIEHVGSTSVPSLPAKPIIDIDIIVTRPNVQTAIDALEKNGHFTYLGELGIIDRHAMKDPDQEPKRNIYVCVDGAAQPRNHLAVRDTLRTNKALREEYAKVKMGLSTQKGGIDIVSYLKGKTAVILKILKESGVMTEEELKAVEEASMIVERFGAVKTERLVLREFHTTDAEGLFESEGNEENARYQSYEPKTRKQAQEEVLQILQDSALIPRTHYELAVTLPDSTFIGRVGANVNRKSDPPHADLWFSLKHEAQGKGFATEAMAAFIPLLGGGLRLEIECDPRNTGSWRVAEKLGFERISLTERAFECKGEWVGSLVYQKNI